MNVHFRTEAIIFGSEGFTPLELQYLDASFIRWAQNDQRNGGARNAGDQAFLALALMQASAIVNGLIQLQGRPADIHGFGGDYRRLLSNQQIARANYYYLLWDNLNSDPADVGTSSWWGAQNAQRRAILKTIADEFPDDKPEQPDKGTDGEKQTITAADVAVIEPETP